MKNFRLILIIFLASACANLDEAKKVLKMKNFIYDEFLVKKEPLTLPPDFDKLPLPNSISENKEILYQMKKRLKKI